jgi:hypothetical protein
MGQTECSETLAFKLQTAGNKPEESVRQPEPCWRRQDFRQLQLAILDRRCRKGTIKIDVNDLLLVTNDDHFLFIEWLLLCLLALWTVVWVGNTAEGPPIKTGNVTYLTVSAFSSWISRMRKHLTVYLSIYEAVCLDTNERQRQKDGERC